jgi:hypothetical protein
MWLAQLWTPRNVLRAVGAVLLSLGVFAIYMGTSSPLVWFLAAMGAVTAGGSFLVDSALAARRQREATAFATMHGWMYYPHLNGVLAMLHTPPFNATDARYVDVIAGTFGGYECYDGTYEWRVRIDDRITITGRHRVAVVRLADELPRLMLIPEGVTSAVSKLFGGQDRDFESAAFNRNWRVVCADPRIAHDMLGPRVLARLESLPQRAPILFERGLAVRIDREGEGTSTLASRLGGLLAVARFLPRHTIDDHGKYANSIGPLPSVATPGAFTGGYRPDLAEADEQHRRTARKRKEDRRFPGVDPVSLHDTGRLAPGSDAR